MGSGESTTRKVSFGVDDEERVRILRGVKLSEDVLQRMRGVANMPPPRAPPSTSSQTDIGTSFSANSSNRSQQNSQQRAQSSTQSKTSKTTAKVKEAQRKSEHQQSILREMETGKEEMIKAMSRERKQTRQEAEKAKQLNMEMYEQSKEQFHQAASKTESHVRSRNTDPVCSGLQSQILACYKENGQQTLRCSELAKEYMRCINTAKRNNLVNHG
ncbi:MICOS complex subunit mic25a-like isoform X2 [Dunckerocampus dactyliophorus]|uniref:MICOS complex subunit mic25a-like isoform X2 n=1 Tax=Dunckerocampus dactyliophorus TaxID=161453 RepID=UPI00240569A8|nr:MICOS complex subunit mic25a-like isoform X2 [Dunckerocampus dactyliophorus]